MYTEAISYVWSSIYLLHIVIVFLDELRSRNQKIMEMPVWTFWVAVCKIYFTILIHIGCIQLYNDLYYCLHKEDLETWFHKGFNCYIPHRTEYFAVTVTVIIRLIFYVGSTIINFLIFMIDSCLNTYISEPASQIEPQIYLGGMLEYGKNPQWFKEKKITHILSIGYSPRKSEYENFKISGIKIIHGEDEPITDLFSYFQPIFEWIEKVKSNPNNVIYVHCHMGISRSATIIISYIMKKHNLSYDETYQFVKGKRSCIDPNWGFREQLRAYERLLKSD